ncbi:MAG TPA: type II secretion system protein GspG [Burkholderiales bacterium]|nr:type II secretion system protein GspG [Burkholderiales bacterium]
MHARRASRRASGFTIVEILIVVAILGTLASIAVPKYTDYRERVRVAQAVADITALSLLINSYQLDARNYPENLASVGNADKLDPWGRPYVYLNLQDPKTKGLARKNKNLVPINSDYDLYSIGKDGDSRVPLTATASRDDVIRANDGRFLGLARDYEP